MRLAKRVGRLEGPLPGGRLPAWAVAAEVAAEHGLDPAEVVREAEAILAQADKAGVLGDAAGLATFLAAEGGGNPAEILAEAERITAWGG